MKNNEEHTPITLSALMKRINRRLAHDYRALRKMRRWDHELGNYYVEDVRSGFAVDRHIDPETLGREMQVILPWESVATPE